MRRIASAAAAKKWPRPFQPAAVLAVDQPQVRLVDQGRGLERLARLLLGQLARRQLAQLVVDQRQELLGGLRVALLDGGEDARDVAHHQTSGSEPRPARILNSPRTQVPAALAGRRVWSHGQAGAT